jgi:general secretion pathway protein D
VANSILTSGGQRLCTAAACCVILMLCTAAAVCGQEPEMVLDTATQEIVLDFRDADLRLVIGALAELSRVTVIYGQLPDQKVTLRTGHPLTRQQLPDLLQRVARSAGLATYYEDGVLHIGHSGRAEMPGRNEAAGLEEESRLYVQRLRHARAEALAHTIRDLFGLASSPGARSEQARRPLSQELRADRIAPIQSMPGPPISEGVSVDRVPAGLPGSVRQAVQIVADQPNNALLIRATPADFEVIQQAIQELDIRPLQVLIEVLIAEVRRDRHRDVGVDISVPERASGRLGGAAVGGELAGRSAGDFALRVLSLGRIEADVMLRAIASSGDVTILSRPVVLAQNNQQARILVGSQRPFIQLFRALPTDAAVRDQIVQYRDVGTQLSIQPTINPDGYVTLTVLQEVSTATTETQFGAPIISTREAETQLLVRDGQTAVIGGLVDRERSRANTGVPILRSIPIVGLLFRSSQRQDQLTELFIFLTPHVLWTDEDVLEATDGFRGGTQRLRRELPSDLPLLRRPGERTREQD